MNGHDLRLQRRKHRATVWWQARGRGVWPKEQPQTQKAETQSMIKAILWGLTKLLRSSEIVELWKVQFFTRGKLIPSYWNEISMSVSNQNLRTFLGWDGFWVECTESSCEKGNFVSQWWNWLIKAVQSSKNSNFQKFPIKNLKID